MTAKAKNEAASAKAQDDERNASNQLTQAERNKASKEANDQAVTNVLLAEPLTADAPKDNKIAKARDAAREIAKHVTDAVDEIERADASDRDPLTIRALHATLSDAASRVGRYVTA